MVLSKPTLQFRAPPAKTDIPPESNMRDRVCDATADVPANPTHRENPAAGKLHGVDDFIVCPCLRIGNTALCDLVPLAPQGFPFAACSLESKE
jgi:hypothetical protein